MDRFGFGRGPALFLLALVALLIPGRAQAADLVVDAAAGFIIPVEVNGHLLQLRVDPETPGYVVVNPGVARRIGLRPSLLSGYAQIGPVRLDGDTKVAEITHAGIRFSRRFAWVSRDAIADADGLINPAGLPYDRVIFNLGPAQAGDVGTVFRLDYEREYGLVFPARSGERTIRFQFSTTKPQSLATAAAGAQLASLHGGSWSGEPFEQLIEYSVRRPVRPMTLERPVSLHGWRASRFLVRTGDHRGNNALPSEPSSDPEEIVVTAVTDSGQEAIYMLTFGMDRLSQCSSMTYEKSPHRLTLLCRPGAPAG